MSLSFRVLGNFRNDNALFVSVDTGQHVSRLMFDCGDGCPHALSTADLLAMDHLFFSHFHMDHVSGFDLFFRLNFDREPAVNVWAPPGGTEILHHRFRGFEWNLVGNRQPGTWLVHEIDSQRIRTTRFHAREAFRTAHAERERPRTSTILEGDGFTVESHQLDHGCPSMGYVVREASRVNVDPAKLAAAGFAPGPWVKRLRGASATSGETVTINGVEHSLAALQTDLLVTTPGDSIAYLTDFRLNTATMDYLTEHLRGVNTVVCESQYRGADVNLAQDVMHSTAGEAATLAARAGIGKLLLFHVSSRYEREHLSELLTEGRAIFPNTSFPEGWED